MTRILPIALLALAATSARADSKPADAPKTDEDKTLYTLGAMLGSQIKPLELTPAELAKMRAGMEDAALGKKLQVELNDYAGKAQAFAKKRQDEGSAREATKQKEASRGFLEAAAKEAGAQSFPSGLIYTRLREGSGPSPTAGSTVQVNYEGKLIDGTIFDSSYKRGEPIEFPLSGVIACWTEGVQKMRVGEKAKLVCPSSIAYGPNGQPPVIPGGATLIFTVELLAIK